jgi:proliferating cell nuclear antigen PCNA
MKFQIQELNKASEWIELFKFIKQLNQYVTFMCKPDELYIQLMDDSHICLIDITIPSTWFSSYISENQTFSVMTNILVKILSVYTADTIIEFNAGDEKLNIQFKNKKENKSYEINMLDIEKDILSPAMPNTKIDFIMKTKTFDRYVNELAIFGDEAIVYSNDDKLYLKAKGDEGSISIEIEGDNLIEFSVVEGFNVETRYCLKYLQYISKLHYPNVHLYLDDESPLVITFDDSTIKIKYYLAPKSDNTD